MKPCKPVVSVTMPYYRGEKYLREAVDSVAAQTFTDLELVVVDDGSPGIPVSDLLHDVTVPRIKVVRHEANRGLGAARNTGFFHAQGMYVLPLDHDDLIKPPFVEKCVAVLADERIGAVFSQVEIFGRQEEIWSPECSLIEIMAGNAVPSTIMYRRALFESIGGYQEGMASVDTDFWIRALSKGWRVCRIEEPLYRYRKHDLAMSNAAQLTEVSDLAAANPDLYKAHMLEVLKGFERRYNKKINEYSKLDEGFKALNEEFKKLSDGHTKLLAAYEALLERERKRSLMHVLRKLTGHADKSCER